MFSSILWNFSYTSESYSPRSSTLPLTSSIITVFTLLVVLALRAHYAVRCAHYAGGSTDIASSPGIGVNPGGARGTFKDWFIIAFMRSSTIYSTYAC